MLRRARRAGGAGALIQVNGMRPRGCVGCRNQETHEWLSARYRKEVRMKLLVDLAAYLFIKLFPAPLWTRQKQTFSGLGGSLQ